MLPPKLAFVDIETTGTRAFYDRVLEIGILRVENNQITQTYQTLLNPQTYIPSQITQITGITTQDITNAPTFHQIKDNILEILDDCIFVAHNVRFDYSFLKNEFQRENHKFSPRHLCTVRLSRALYPQHTHHNLATLIERFGFTYTQRHRALDDAKVIYQFYQKIQTDFPPETLAQAINRISKHPSLPLHLKTDPNTLPESPGVYIFYDQDTAPLYVGKSKNLKQRVLSHFSADLRSPLEMKISQQVHYIEIQPTAGELGALLLESHLIKTLLPSYNRKSRLKKELITIKKITNKDGYDTIELQTISETLPLLSFAAIHATILGIFKSRQQAKTFLTTLTKQYQLCEKLLNLEKTKTACFAHRLGQCKGACLEKETPQTYNLRFTMAFADTKIKPWPFNGPILIKEENTYNVIARPRSGSEVDAAIPSEQETNYSTTEYFLIDNWCYLGKIKEDTQGAHQEDTTKSPTFDVDTYNIIKQFLTQPQNYQKIKTLPKNFSHES